MTERNLTYFVADVHLGLDVYDPAAREARFVRWLKDIPADRTRALYLLGDIWDFWYEYRFVIPSEGFRVLAELVRLADEGVEVYFFPGNHDIWCYRFFESVGIRKLSQPGLFGMDGKLFLAGHGDGLGGAPLGYRLMNWIFNCRFAQKLFSALHPTTAFKLGMGWSNSNRHRHGEYHFRGADEPLYKFCDAYRTPGGEAPDFCIFGHFHEAVDTTLPSGARLVVLKDWIGDTAPHFACWDGASLTVR